MLLRKKVSEFVSLQDAITKLLEYSEENAKVNPTKFFHE